MSKRAGGRASSSLQICSQLFLSLIANRGRIWSDTGSCCMKHPSPSSSSHTGLGRGQLPAVLAKRLLLHHLFLSSSHRTFESLKHHEITVDVNDTVHDWAVGSLPHPRR